MRIAFGFVLAGLMLLSGTGVGQGPKGTTTKAGPAKATPGNDTAPANPWPTIWGGKTLEQWMKQIHHPDASKRTTALLALINFGPPASNAVRLVIGKLSDPDVGVRAKAALVLRLLDISAGDVNDVIKALARKISPENESQAVIRYEAAKSLARFSADAGQVVPFLVIGAHDKSAWEIRHMCVSILWRAGMDAKTGPDPRAVQGLLDWLPNEKTYLVRLEILSGLAMMGKPTNPALLQREINDLLLCARPRSVETNKPLIIWAYAGLAVVADGAMARKAMANITSHLTDPKETLEVRSQAAHALGTLGPLAKSKVPILVDMLKDKEAVVVNGACLALIRIADKSDAVVDALIEVMQHKDPQRAGSAVKALVDLKVKTPKVTGAMDKLRENKNLDLGLRSYIEAGLKELKTPSK